MRLKWPYIAIIVLIIAAYSVAWFLEYSDTFELDSFSEKINLAIAVIALIISIISLGIADPKQKKLKLKLSVWNRGEENRLPGSADISSYAFQLVNLNDQPLEDLVVAFRFQKSNFYKSDENPQNNNYFEFGHRIIAQNKMIKYLGIHASDNFVRFEHYLQEMSQWEKGKIAITISCRGFVPYTFQIDNDEKEELLKTTISDPKNYFKNK